MKLKIELTDKAARDILTTAVQQGCAYWANDYKRLNEKRDREGYTIRFSIGDPIKSSQAEGTPPLHRTVTVKTIQRAVQRMIDTQGTPKGVHPSYVYELLKCYCGDVDSNADAMTCDAVLQLAVFEQVVYG